MLDCADMKKNESDLCEMTQNFYSIKNDKK